MISDIRRSLPRAAWWTLNVALTVLFLSPLVVMLSMAFKSSGDQGHIPPTLLPQHPTWHNFVKLTSVQGLNIFHNLLNSVMVSVSATLLVVLFASMAGYGIARTKFPGAGIVFFVALASFMIPFQAILTPLYMLLKNMGLNDSLVGLTLVYVTFNLPFALFIMRNAFASVPQALEEAARIDGCGTIRAIVQIMLPIVKPGLITASLMAFFNTWNEFFAALILVTSQEKFTLPVTLTMVASGSFGQIDWGSLQAGVALTIIPCIVVYLLLQRYYVSGMLSGALK
jgi:multiple sugar transport system permease protein